MAMLCSNRTNINWRRFWHVTLETRTALVSVQNILQRKYAQNNGAKKNQWTRSLRTLCSNCSAAQNFPSEMITGHFVRGSIFRGFESSGMWHCVTGWVVANVLFFSDYLTYEDEQTKTLKLILPVTWCHIPQSSATWKRILNIRKRCHNLWYFNA